MRPTVDTRCLNAWSTFVPRCAMLMLLALYPAIVIAQGDSIQSSMFPSARDAVREGNRLLREGKAAEALQAYEQAQSLEPDALEIPFVQGLSKFKLNELDAARDLWSRAALAEDASLADAATYSIGTTYHAEALQPDVDSEKSTQLLEQAMERYQQVLSHDADHVAARDSLRKAAALRRQIQDMQKQQQEQQPNQEESDEEKQDKEEQQSEQQSEESDQSEKSDQNSEQSQQQQDQQNQQSSEQQDQQQQQSSDQQQDQESESQSSQEDQQDQEAPKDGEEPADPPDAEQKEGQSEESPTPPQEDDLSRDQAERQLREMMQSLRDRQKQRKQTNQRPPLRPADKDW